MNWKLKENIRLNKVCSTCLYGTHLTGSKEVELCTKDMEIEDSWEYRDPELSPRIKTCLEWTKEKND